MKDKRLTIFELIRGAAAIMLALTVAMIFIFLCSAEPFKALYQLLVGPLVNSSGSFSPRGIYTILAAMIPTIFTGLATCVMFSASQFNLASEGTVMAGGFIAALCGIYMGINSGLHAVVCVLIAAVACGIVMLIPALLKVKLGASEMVTSLMLNYIIQYIVLHYLNYDFADRSKGSTQTFPFEATAKIPELVSGGSKLTWGFIIALLFVALVTLFLYRTRWGYSIRMIGINKAFAEYSGMKVGGVIVLAQVVGGVLAGMGGSIEVLGRYDTFLWRELPGYGWKGVTIAILAKNNPAFVPIAAFFIAYLERGCNMMATRSDVPAEMIDIIQAAIFLFFAAEQFLSGYRQKLVVRNTQSDLAKQAQAAEGGQA